MRYSSFQIGCVIVVYDLLNATTFIQNLQTGIVQNLRFLGFILYPLSLVLYSPFNIKKNTNILKQKTNTFHNSSLVILFWIHSKKVTPGTRSTLNQEFPECTRNPQSAAGTPRLHQELPECTVHTRNPQSTMY